VSRVLRRLVSASLLYAVGDILGRALLFVLIPVWTHYLSPEEFGSYEVLRVAGLVLTTLAGLALSTSVVRRSVERDPQGMRRFYGSVYAFQVAVALGLFAVLEWSGDGLFGALFSQGALGYVPYGRILVIYSLLGVLPVAPMGMLLFRERAGLHVALYLGAFSAKAALSLWFVVQMGLGLGGLLWAELFTALLLVPASFVLVRREASLAFDPQAVRAALAYSLPLVPHTLAHLVLTSSDRYVLQASHGARAVGVYGVAYLFSSALTVGSMAMNKAMSPFLFKSCQRLQELGALAPEPGATLDPEARAERGTLGLGMAAFYAAVGLAGLVGVLVAPEVVRYAMSEDYGSALPLIPWVVWGAALHGAYLVAVNLLFYFKKTVSVAVISGGAAILNLLLNLWLVPAHGALAAAITTLVAYALLALGVYLAAGRCLRVPYPWRRLAVLTALVVPGGVLAQVLELLPAPALRLGLKAALLLLLPLPILLGGLLRPSEIKALLAQWRPARRGPA